CHGNSVTNTTSPHYCTSINQTEALLSCNKMERVFNYSNIRRLSEDSGENSLINRLCTAVQFNTEAFDHHTPKSLVKFHDLIAFATKKKRKRENKRKLTSKDHFQFREGQANGTAGLFGLSNKSKVPEAETTENKHLRAIQP
ncbi:hypothetical protein PanWU01x14_331750, partial [Parasponia andersonii]